MIDHVWSHRIVLKTRFFWNAFEKALDWVADVNLFIQTRFITLYW